MNQLHGIKYVAVTNPAAIVNNASFTTNEVDTNGYNYATFIVQVGATDIAMSALKVQESDTSGSGFADISGADLSSGSDIEGNATAVPSSTDDDSIHVLQMSLTGRKRYLDLVATAGNGSTGTYLSAVCLLSQAKLAPDTVAEHGLGNLVQL